MPTRENPFTTFGKSLLSRKFLLTLGATATFIANKQYTEALTAVLAFLGVEGAADVVSRKQ